MTQGRLKTAIVGAGYVGIATAVGLAEQGRDVVLVEQDPDRLAALVGGRIPFHEPGLPEAFAVQHAAGRILPSSEIPRDGLDLIVICVGTPIDDTGYADVSQVARALDQAVPAIAAGAACVIRSTLPVGSAARLASRPGVTSERSSSRRSSCARAARSRTSAGPRGSSSGRSTSTRIPTRSRW